MNQKSRVSVLCQNIDFVDHQSCKNKSHVCFNYYFYKYKNTTAYTFIFYTPIIRILYYSHPIYVVHILHSPRRLSFKIFLGPSPIFSIQNTFQYNRNTFSLFHRLYQSHTFHIIVCLLSIFLCFDNTSKIFTVSYSWKRSIVTIHFWLLFIHHTNFKWDVENKEFLHHDFRFPTNKYS